MTLEIINGVDQVLVSPGSTETKPNTTRKCGPKTHSLVGLLGLNDKNIKLELTHLSSDHIWKR